MHLGYKSERAAAALEIQVESEKAALDVITFLAGSGASANSSERPFAFLMPANRREAIYLLNIAVRSMRCGEALDPFLAAWLSNGLDKIARLGTNAKSADVAAAVGFGRAAHRPRANEWRDFRIWQRVTALREAGGTLEAACSTVAGEFELDESNAKKIYLRTNKEVVPF